jgi:hypothetical protein
MKANEIHFAQFQNLVKTIKVGDEHLAQLQTQISLIEEAINAEGKHRAQIQKEVAFGVYGTDGRRSSIHGIPRQHEDTEDILYCSFQRRCPEKEDRTAVCN